MDVARLVEHGSGRPAGKRNDSLSRHVEGESSEEGRGGSSKHSRAMTTRSAVPAAAQQRVPAQGSGISVAWVGWRCTCWVVYMGRGAGVKGGLSRPRTDSARPPCLFGRGSSRTNPAPAVAASEPRSPRRALPRSRSLLTSPVAVACCCDPARPGAAGWSDHMNLRSSFHVCLSEHPEKLSFQSGFRGRIVFLDHLPKSVQMYLHSAMVCLRTPPASRRGWIVRSRFVDLSDLPGGSADGR